MRVNLIYRNYRPLHSMFASILLSPPSGVEVFAQKPSPLMGKPLLFKIYRKFGQTLLFRMLINNVVSPIFSKPDKGEYDIYHYINMVPKNLSKGPFLVEFEHVGALLNFVFDKKNTDKVIEKLKNPKCKAIICSTEASRTTLKKLSGDEYKNLKEKVFVIYPAPDRKLEKIDRNLKDNKSKINILFVGNDSYRKGFEEIIVALKEIPRDKSKKVIFNVVSNDAKKIIDKYDLNNVKIKYFNSNFSKQSVIDNFFKKSDILLFPTKQDTFGYVLIDAMSVGLPVISTKQFAVPEIIQNNKNGILLDIKKPILDEHVYLTQDILNSVSRSNFDRELANEIKKAIIKIIDDAEYLANLRSGSIDFYKESKFSLEKKNKKLLEIYKSMLIDEK